MKLPLFLFCALSSLAAAESAPPAKAPAPPYNDPPPAVPLSPAVREHLASLTPIFDGKTLDGWIQASRAPVKNPAGAWIVKDGALASTGDGRGVIYTKDDYAHYRVVFQVRQISGNHVPGVLVFCARPAPGEAALDALGAVQFQVPRGGHWDYRPGINKAGEHFTRPVRIGFKLNEWAQVELLVNAKTGVARMAVAQPPGTKGIELLVFDDPKGGKIGPFALQMHNAGLFDEYRDLKIEVDPKDDRLITVE